MRPLSGLDLKWLWEELALAIRQGQTLTTALFDLWQANAKTSRGKVARALADSLRAGQSLSAAVRAQPKIFPSNAAPALAAGEQSGRLAEVLHTLAEDAEMQNSIRHGLVAGIAYPIVIGLAGLAITFFIQLWVMPRFAYLYTHLDVWDVFNQGTWATVVLLLQVECIALFLLPILLLALLYIVPSGVLPRWRILDVLRIRFPLIGKAVRLLCLWQWAASMKMLIGVGMPEHVAVALAGQSCGNLRIEEECAAMGREIESGKRLGSVLDNNHFFEPIFAWMVRMCEDRGEYDKFWSNSVELFKRNASTSVHIAVNLLAIAIWCVAAQIVGTAVTILFLPMVRLMNAIGG